MANLFLMTDYKIEKLQPEEFNLLIPLMKDCFGMDVNIDYFRWKYLQNPVGELIAFVAKAENDQLVAFEGLIPEKYSLFGETKIVYQSVDTMTHSQHRRKGLFQKVAFAGYEYLKQHSNLFVLGFGGKQSAPALYKFGWKSLFDVQFYFKTYQQIYLQNIFKPDSGNQYIIKPADDLNEIIPIIQLSHSKKKISKFINFELLKWKLSNPRFNYQTFGIYCDNKLKGYVIFYIQNNKIMLFDANFADEAGSCEFFLFKWLDKKVLTNKYNGIVTFSQSNIPFSKILKRKGFIVNNLGIGPLKQKLPFMVYTENDTFEEINNPNFWAVKPIYHDSF